MNDDDRQNGYEELRWLARDARKSYRQTTMRSAAGIAVAMSLAIGAVALNQSGSPIGGSDDHDNIIKRLIAIADEVHANNLLGSRISETQLKDMPDIAQNIQAKVDRLDYSDWTRADLQRQLERLLERVDGSNWTRDDLKRQLDGLESSLDFSHTTWLQSFADGPSQGIWRMYPMSPGDTLWIPDGNFFVRLVDATTSEILMQVFPDGTPQPDDPWVLQLAGYEQVPVGNYRVNLYYARSRSARPGFGGGSFLDVAICWSAAQDRCPQLVPDYLLQGP